MGVLDQNLHRYNLDILVNLVFNAIEIGASLRVNSKSQQEVGLAVTSIDIYGNPRG